VGNIVKRSNRNSATYCVQNIKDLTNVIIPHFNKYSLLTQKKADFILFSRCIDTLLNNLHLDIKDIEKILSLKSSMGKNIGLSQSLNIMFPNIIAADRPVVNSQKIESKL